MARMQNREERLAQFLIDFRETAKRLEEWVKVQGSLLAATDMPEESRTLCEETTQEHALKLRELYSEIEYLLKDK